MKCNAWLNSKTRRTYDSANSDLLPDGRRCLGRIRADTETQHVALDRVVLDDPDGQKLSRFNEVVEMLYFSAGLFVGVLIGIGLVALITANDR